MSAHACPACGSTHRVRQVAEIHHTAAGFGDDDRNVPYIVLLSRTTQVPSPPQPPPIPPPLAPRALAKPDWSAVARRHLVPFAVIVAVSSVVWFVVAAVYSTSLPAGSDHLTVADVLSAPPAFAFLVSLVYMPVVLVVEESRRAPARDAWHLEQAAYRWADNVARGREAARMQVCRAAYDRAHEVMAAACYCQGCDRCFWPTAVEGGVAVGTMVSRDRFREMLVEAGGYHGLGELYQRI